MKNSIFHQAKKSTKLIYSLFVEVRKSFVDFMLKNITNIASILVQVAIGWATITIMNNQFKETLRQTAISSSNSKEMFDQQMSQSRNLSDSLMHQSRLLNDSLIFLLASIQKATNEQIEITHNQLQQQKYEGIPNIIPISTEENDSLGTDNKVYPHVIFNLKNTGSRTALNATYRMFIIKNNYSALETVSAISNGSENRGPSTAFKLEFHSGIPIDSDDAFYTIIEVKYLDAIVKKGFNYTESYHCSKNNGRYECRDCWTQEKGILFPFVNNYLMNKREPVLEQP